MLPRTEPRSGAFSLDHSFSPFHKLEKISVKEPSLVRNLKKKAAYTIHLITFYMYNLYLLFNENSFIDFPHYTDNRTLPQEKKNLKQNPVQIHLNCYEFYHFESCS